MDKCSSLTPLSPGNAINALLFLVDNKPFISACCGVEQNIYSLSLHCGRPQNKDG